MVIRRREFLILGRGETLTEDCGWMFVDNVPLLFRKRRVARQLQVETWLDLAQLVKELRIDELDLAKTRNVREQPSTRYVV